MVFLGLVSIMKIGLFAFAHLTCVSNVLPACPSYILMQTFQNVPLTPLLKTNYSHSLSQKLRQYFSSNSMSFPGGSDGKQTAHSVGDPGSSPEFRTSPGGGHGNPLQYSCLENSLRQSRLAGYSLSGHTSWT